MTDNDTNLEDYAQLSIAIADEISAVLKLVDANEVDALIAELQNADRIFVIAVGRVFLSLQCFAKRLAHLGLNVDVVGQVTEKAITDRDLLLVASGSGESAFPVAIARKAKDFNARIALITSAKTSTIASLADCMVRLPSPTKLDGDFGVTSVQPMSTLFDQVLHIFGDVVAMKILSASNAAKDDLWRYHANLE
jgi:6-phospho-3-hexuloisomerase